MNLFFWYSRFLSLLWIDSNFFFFEPKGIKIYISVYWRMFFEKRSKRMKDFSFYFIIQFYFKFVRISDWCKAIFSSIKLEMYTPSWKIRILDKFHRFQFAESAKSPRFCPFGVFNFGVCILAHRHNCAIPIVWIENIFLLLIHSAMRYTFVLFYFFSSLSKNYPGKNGRTVHLYSHKFQWIVLQYV